MQDPALDVNLYNPPFDVNNSIFLQNLRQLRTNLNNIHQAANAPAGHLDVATIANNLHNGLRQSAFTDSRGQFNVPPAVPGAVILNPGHPASPFTVNSGRSAWGVWANANDDVPMYSLVAPAVLSPAVANKAQMPCPPSDAASINTVVGQAGGLFPTLTAAEIQTKILGPAANFSGNIQVAQLQPGRIIVRCCQRGSPEPGGWWVSLQDMPLGITPVRSGTAVLPNWNQNGNLEFFVVPEGCGIVILEGQAASQALGGNLSTEGQRSYWQLGVGQHLDAVNDRVLPLNQPLRGSNLINVTGQILQGGATQIYVMENGAGAAFFNPGGANDYMPCIALIETGFDVELQ